MKLKIGIILAVLAAMIPAANAVIVNIEVGDQPITSTGRGTMSALFTTFGHRGIGRGITITRSGFTAITCGAEESAVC